MDTSTLPRHQTDGSRVVGFIYGLRVLPHPVGLMGYGSQWHLAGTGVAGAVALARNRPCASDAGKRSQFRVKNDHFWEQRAPDTGFGRPLAQHWTSLDVACIGPNQAQGKPVVRGLKATNQAWR